MFWHPKGSTIRKIIEDFWKDEHVRQGYQLLYTPHMANLNLWKTSGEWASSQQRVHEGRNMTHSQWGFLVGQGTSTSTRTACSTRWRWRTRPTRLSP